MKIPMKPSGIEPATFRFVAQHLNHCATAAPPLVLVSAYFIHLQLIPEAVITVVRAPDDGCQHPKHVELPTEI